MRIHFFTEFLKSKITPDSKYIGPFCTKTMIKISKIYFSYIISFNTTGSGPFFLVISNVKFPDLKFIIKSDSYP